ncbi:unnamed protein product [Rhizoctonia solani]|uniref:Uncharacterized protein n=1 Tax=Rhizoctonia solani TaxID=456999 RepID=A0A8H3DU28_9AGAM|nr:unnamed protein product [Rhizoctonia solani]
MPFGWTTAHAEKREAEIQKSLNEIDALLACGRELLQSQDSSNAFAPEVSNNLTFRHDELTARSILVREALSAQSVDFVPVLAFEDLFYANVGTDYPMLQGSQSNGIILEIPMQATLTGTALSSQQAQSTQPPDNSYYRVYVHVGPDRSVVVLDPTPHSGVTRNPDAERLLNELSSPTTNAMESDSAGLETRPTTNNDAFGTSIIQSIISALARSVPN